MKRMAQNFEYSAKLTPCKYYARGYCARGATCFYAHTQVSCGPMVGNTQSSIANYTYDKATLAPSAETVKSCLDYNQGFCAKGSSCPLKHIQLPQDMVLFIVFTYIGYRYQKS